MPQLLRWCRLVLVTGMLAGAIDLAAKPAVLIGSPQGAAYGYADLQYLRELQQNGFEIDYTDSLADITWDRIKLFNVLVLYYTPDAFAVIMQGQKPSTERIASFAALMEKYLDAGGGIFLMAPECHMGKQVLADLTDRWGAKFPGEIVVENNKDNLAALTHSCQGTELAFTDQILPSPISEGVKQLWYPCRPAYNGAMSGPLVLDETWQVVVKASKTAVTKAVDTSQSPSRIPGELVRPQGVPEPPLMAIRSLKAGRVSVINQWPQFSFGSGTRWIFNREVLDKGVKNRPSDFGRLIQNTFRWLAEPSLKTTAVGGFVTKPERLQPPNEQESAKKDYTEHPYAYDPAALGNVEIPAHLKMYRGLLGAKSTLSSGTGTVAEYALAARAAKLDFLIFMEDFAKLTPAKLTQLTAECRQNSDAALLLLPGFCMPNNVGNHMFFYSPDPVWPPDLVLTGADKSVLYIQEVKDGKFTGYLTPYLDWVLGAYHVDKGQVGYYNFTDSPHGMRLPDCRLYAAAGVRYYKGGKLVEDVTPAYLTTALCTIPPAPLAVNEVTSPAELTREVASGNALIMAQAASLDPKAGNGVFQAALRWTHQYDSLNVFASDGPVIAAWPNCHRVWAYGGEEFVRGPAVMPSPVSVHAEKGLKEIRIYNGETLFRRFLCGGQKEFNQLLVLDGSIHKNLVLIAEDMAGGKAVSFARRCWKDGALSPSFCSDHVNDGLMLLAHGPYNFYYNRVPELPANLAGDTWDGGPPAMMPPTRYQSTLPVLDCDKGLEDGGRFDQIPELEYTDEGAAAVCQVRKELYDERIVTIVNPWHTYGPISGPSKLFDVICHYRQWVTPTIGAPESGWAAPGLRVGVNASLLQNEIIFKEDVTVKTLTLGFMALSGKVTLVVAAGSDMKEYDTDKVGPTPVELKRGDWFGLYSKEFGNGQIYINRGEPIRLEVSGYLWLKAQLDGKPLKKGDRYVHAVAALGFPLDVEVKDAATLKKYVDYLRQPEGLQLLRGRRLDLPGLMDLTPDNFAVELTIPKPAVPLNLTLPVRIMDLNPRWSAGLFQKKGYSKGYYGPGENRYRAMGLDFAGTAHIPLYVDKANITAVVAGHPVVAGPEGRDLFIQVTNVGGTPDRWHIAVNNPLDQPVTTILKKAMDLPRLTLADTPITLQPGEYKVIQ